MQKNLYAVAVLALTMAVVPACATKKLVRTEVGAVNAKVDTLNTAVEATQERTLYEQHQVPLHKINVISYGEDKPVAPNTTRAGRGQNRRVVVRVLS